MWSQVNREHVARLTAAGRMTPHGQRQIDAAKADGRWDAAYAPMRRASEATIPADLRAAIEANPRARKTFKTLGRQNLFALGFRTNNMKTPAGARRRSRRSSRCWRAARRSCRKRAASTLTSRLIEDRRRSCMRPGTWFVVSMFAVSPRPMTAQQPGGQRGAAAAPAAPPMTLTVPGFPDGGTFR